MKYTIFIEETIVQEFDVIAESPKDALSLAKDKYKNGEFVLEFGEVQFKQMAINTPFNGPREWQPF